MITFFVPGKAAPGGSKKGFYIAKIKRVVMAPASDKTKPWMAIVSAFAREAYTDNPLTGPLAVTMTFKILRPKNHYRTGKNAGILRDDAQKYCTVKPDLTKLERSTEDALTGIIWRDDSQVAQKNTQKIYVEKDPGVEITVQQIGGGSERRMK